MVHNGIEYGVMAAYAEGLNILAHANAGLQNAAVDAETAPLAEPRYFQYELNVAAIAEVWRHGSIIASRLLDLTAAALARTARSPASAATSPIPARVAGQCRRRSRSACPRTC
jgi:6-phosphogluconate dehydrogenase